MVDPGIYSWQSGLVTPELLNDIDAVVVTHIHPDHLSADFARAIHEASSSASWYGPQQVVNQLASWGIDGLVASSDRDIRFIESVHADLSPLFNEQPEHTSFVLFNDLLIGGDCHTLADSHGARIFGAAINGGPWGAVIGFARMIESMSNRPQIVIPLHDWHFHDEARRGIYVQLPDVMSQFGVEFVPLENGISKQV